MNDVFRALADPTRRSLLDELFGKDGQTLSALQARVPMSVPLALIASPPATVATATTPATRGSNRSRASLSTLAQTARCWEPGARRALGIT